MKYGLTDCQFKELARDLKDGAAGIYIWETYQMNFVYSLMMEYT